MDQPSPEEEYGPSDAESTGDDHDIKAESAAGSPSGSGKNAPAVKPPGHLQKRRRVTRACDECRRKKIKCDGKQPCTHCTVYSYECTYDQPSNRRRNPAPQYVENLEHRVHRAETLLHILIPNLDLNDPGIDAAVAQGWIPGAPGKGNPAAAVPDQRAPRPTLPNDKKSDANLESMIRAIGHLDMDETGHWDYHGHTSGLIFIRRMREQLGDMMGPETHSTPFVKSRPLSQSQVIETPRSLTESPSGELSPTGLMELPPKDTAVRVCGYALNDAAALLRMVHQPTFWESVNQLYSTSPDHYTNEDNQFLILFYSALALGSLFDKDKKSVRPQGYEGAIQHGFAYFKTARQMMDIADCRDLTSLQAVVFMILFLQSSAKLSQCYAYIGHAQRSALRMGLHRAVPGGRFNPIQIETRKRVFWIIRTLDIYVSAMIGMPITLSDDDIDQEFPLEVDDEYITKTGVLPMPEGIVSLMTSFNAHTRLVLMLGNIVRKVYPTKVAGGEDRSYSVPFSTIRELESEMEQWKTSLHPMLSPSDTPSRFAKIQQLLRMSYAHAQVMLYRPFLHFVAMDKRAKPVDQRAYACAASFVNVSRNIIHIATHMKQKGMLNGAFWFVSYTSFFSILALVYFAAENPDSPTTQAIMKDAIEGREVLSSLAENSMAADRCAATLDEVFQRLPTWMRDGQQNPVMTKKRPFQSGEARHHMGEHVAAQSHPNIPTAAQEPQAGAKRASTFPRVAQSAMAGNQSPLDGSWSQSARSYGPQTPTTTNTLETNGFVSMSLPNGVNAVTCGMPFTMPPELNSSALSDLSSMIFPSAEEPFVYPNQPLTTFENNQQFAKDRAFVNGQPYHAGLSPLHRRDENMEAQFYALPPYLEQRQQIPPPPPSFGYPQSAMPYTNGQATSTPQAVRGMPNGHWTGGPPAYQQDVPNVNIQELFGGTEWSPMMMHPSYP